MNMFKKKIQVFCISNIMASLLSTNIASATFTLNEEATTLVNAPQEVETEELEPVSQSGGDDIIVAEVAPQTNVVTQREYTSSISYVPARYSELTGQAVVDYARRYLGLRYVSGGYSLSTGTDCSGFTKLIYSEFGVYLPRTVSGQMYSGSYVRKDDLRKGDLVIYGNGGGYPTHVTIYIGNGQVIHESNHRDGVKISTLYMMQYITARRVINDTAINLVEQKVDELVEEAKNENTAEEKTTVEDKTNDSTNEKSTDNQENLTSNNQEINTSSDANITNNTQVNNSENNNSTDNIGNNSTDNSNNNDSNSSASQEVNNSSESTPSVSPPKEENTNIESSNKEDS